MSSRHLILVGAGHAHLPALKQIARFTARGHRVTLVSPTPDLYYRGMGPGALTGIYDEAQMRLPLGRMTEAGGGLFVQDRVVAIEPAERRLVLASDKTIGYDVVSFGIGSQVSRGRVSGDFSGVIEVKPVENLLRARRMILEKGVDGRVNLVVAGGGPAGVEIAGSLWRLLREARLDGRICLVCGGRLLPEASNKLRRLARTSLQRRGIEVCEGLRLKHLEQGRALLSDETERACDLVLLAVGVQPPALFREAALPVGLDGALLVNDRLQCVAHPEIFGGGDCIRLQGEEGPKGEADAMHQGPVLYANLMAALEGAPLKVYAPQGIPLLILDLGDGTGLLQRDSRVLGGRAVLALKNWLDRRVMRAYRPGGRRR